MRKVLTSFLFVLFALVATAQSNSVVIKGFVRDANDRALVGVLIQAIDEEAATVSTQGGTFELRVTPYCRRIKASHPGYADMEAEIDGSIILFRLKEDKKAEKAEISAAKKEAREKKKAERDPRKGRWFASFSLAMPTIKEPDNLAYGFMVGWGSNKVIGGYAKGVFGGDMESIKTSSDDIINSTDGCFGAMRYYDTPVRSRYNALTAGVLLRMACPLHLYAGVGTSWRKVYYGDAISGDTYYISDMSAPKVAIDMGLMWKMKWFNVAVGSIYTPKIGFAGNISVGVCF
ncbi:MAG: carboxypeptidase regulatory-like domain-containing protein [Alistipes sp.]|nr:carboxypeptidase regulatory-like domain-containing protein [Alistipes sp.]